MTGASGVLGQQLQKTASSHGIYYFCPTRKQLDITNPDVNSWWPICGTRTRWDGVCWNAVLHCAAYTNVPGAETQGGRTKAIETNIIGTKNVKNFSRLLGAKFIYISTDYVYEGRAGGYKETDTPSPVNYYALTKYLGEAYATGGLIIRTSFKPCGTWPFLKAFDDLYTSADYVDVIAPMINALLAKDPLGIINVGTERKTIYDLAIRRNAVGRTSISEIKNVNLPADISMNLEKYYKTI